MTLTSIIFLTGCKNSYNRMGYFFVESTSNGYNVSICYDIHNETIIVENLTLPEATILANKLNNDISNYAIPKVHYN